MRSRFVALKFCSAADTTTEQVSRYTRILLQETSPPAAVSPICPAMIDNFLVSGANGQHSVQVLEPLGPTLDVVVDQHYMASAYQGERFNIGHQRRLARRMVQILARLHEVDIVHSNLHIGSFAFRLGKSIQTATTDELDFYTRTQPWGNIFHLERKNCLPLDPQFPQYLVQPRPLEESFRLHLYGGSDRLAILGLRHARDSERGFPEYYELANDNSAPELVIRQGSPTKQSDIWALGCCIYHLIFCVSPFSYHNAEEDEEGPGYLLLDMIRRLGAMPESKPAHQEMSLPIVEDSSEYPIENSLAGLEDEGVSLPEVESLTRFLRRIFQYDPEKRPTARELLSDPWLLQD
ncbi:Hypothetical protein D9617_10g073080 [Elsinoe fawcettii]|nr:Hypothetical protein D9617_10g073080 [Elsinoe fawcettii]